MCAAGPVEPSIASVVKRFGGRLNKKIATTLLGLVVLLTGCGEATNSASKDEGQAVPNVVGLHVGDAIDSLTKARTSYDFQVDSRSRQISSTDYGNWKVDSTDPQAGGHLPQGKQVVVKLVRDPSASPSPTPTRSPTADPTPAAPARSVRGNLIAHVGDTLQLSYKGVPTVTVRVTGITTNAGCQADVFAPIRGQTVVLDMEVTTTPELAQDSQPTFVTIFDWKAVGGDGVTVNGRIDNINCIPPAKRIPSEIGPSEKVVGQMAFDLPPGSGTLIWRPSGVTSGWEWTYPTK